MSGDYITARVATIHSLIGSIERMPGLPADVNEFASAALYQLRLLDDHLKNLRDPAELNRRRGDRGYMGPAVLPHMQTVMLNVEATAEDERARLTFKRADEVKPALPIEERRKK